MCKRGTTKLTVVAVPQAVVKLWISIDQKMALNGSTNLYRPWWRSLEWPGRSLSRSDRWCQLGRGWSYAEDKWSIYGSQRRPWRNLACKLRKKTQNTIIKHITYINGTNFLSFLISHFLVRQRSKLCGTDGDDGLVSGAFCGTLPVTVRV